MSDLLERIKLFAVWIGKDNSQEIIDLIEQQQQRIAELEQQLTQYRIDNLKIKADNNELAATIERLRGAIDYCISYLAENRLNTIGSWSKAYKEFQHALESTPQQNLAERDADVARKAVEEYKLSITEPNATVHRYPVVDLSGFYLLGANGKPMIAYGHIENAESSTSQQAFIKCVIGRLLELLEGFNAESSIVQKKNADKPSVIKASFIAGYTAGNGYPPSDWEVNQYIKSIKDGE